MYTRAQSCTTCSSAYTGNFKVSIAATEPGLTDASLWPTGSVTSGLLASSATADYGVKHVKFDKHTELECDSEDSRFLHFRFASS
jgi:hypothetical protein